MKKSDKAFLSRQELGITQKIQTHFPSVPTDILHEWEQLDTALLTQKVGELLMGIKHNPFVGLKKICIQELTETFAVGEYFRVDDSVAEPILSLEYDDGVENNFLETIIEEPAIPHIDFPESFLVYSQKIRDDHMSDLQVIASDWLMGKKSYFRFYQIRDLKERGFLNKRWNNIFYLPNNVVLNIFWSKEEGRNGWVCVFFNTCYFDKDSGWNKNSLIYSFSPC